MAPSPDRRIATVTFAAAVAVLATTVAVSPSTRPAAGDASALLLERLDRGRRVSAVVTYAFERERDDGRVLEGELVALQRHPLTIFSGMGSLTARDGERRLVCTEAGDEPQCLEPPTASDDGRTDLPDGDAAAGPLAAFEGIVRAGWYDVAGDGTRTVAGERATCFTVERLADVPVPGATLEARYCLADDGLLLWSQVVRPGSIDTRTATTVRRGVDDADASALLEPFGVAAWLTGDVGVTAG